MRTSLVDGLGLAQLDRFHAGNGHTATAVPKVPNLQRSFDADLLSLLQVHISDQAREFSCLLSRRTAPEQGEQLLQNGERKPASDPTWVRTLHRILSQP